MWYSQTAPGAPLVNFTGKLEQTQVDVTIALGTGTVPDGTYNVRLQKNANAWSAARDVVTNSSAFVTVTNGVLSKTSIRLALIHPNGAAGYPITFEDTASSLRFAAYTGSGAPAGTVYVHEWGTGFRKKVGDKDEVPPAATTTTLMDAGFTLYLGGKPSVPVTFYQPVRNVCQESRPVYLQTGQSVQATGDSTTVSPVGVVPPLHTFQEVRDVEIGYTWAWFIGQQVISSGVVTASDILNERVDAPEVMFTCPDTIETDSDGDGIADSEDPDRDGDGIPNERDVSPDGPDLDGDGFVDSVDNDDDGDGIPDTDDPTPRGGPDSSPNDGTKTPPPPSSGGTVTPPNPKPPLTGNPTTGAPGEIDVYDDVKAALEDVSAQTTVPPVDGTVDLGAQPDGVGEKAAISRIDSNIATAEKEVGNIVLQHIETLADSTGIDLPTGLGKKSWWDMTFDWVDGSTKTVRVDLSPYQSTVNALRNLCLFVAYIGAWWFSVKTIRGGIA